MIVTNPFNGLRSWTRAHVEQISKGWWVLLLSGVLSVVAGGIITFRDWSVGDLAAFIGALLIFRGIFTLFGFPVDGSVRNWAMLTGIIEAGIGVAVWVWPGQTLLVIAFFIGWLLLFRGIWAIAGAIAARRVMPFWGWLLALGIVEVVVASYLLSRPALTLVAAVVAIGLVTLLYGAVEIALAFEVKNLPKYFDEVTQSFDPTTNRRPLSSTSA